MVLTTGYNRISGFVGFVHSPDSGKSFNGLSIAISKGPINVVSPFHHLKTETDAVPEFCVFWLFRISGNGQSP
jgi:hypothetical protein